MKWSDVRAEAAQVAATVVLFYAMFRINDALFQRLEFAPGINWVYLPAGMRLLCTLLFAESGALGLLIVSWWVGFTRFFPADVDRAIMGGVLATLAPWMVYRLARRAWGFEATLRHLTPRRLLLLAVGYSLAGPLLHHLWFAWRGQHDLVRGFVAMAIGDFTGTLIVLYGLKGLLALLPRPRP